MTMQIVPSGTKVIFRLPGTQGPPGTTDYNELDNLPTLGTAAATDATDYATAAQGAKADTAVQPARQVIAGAGLTGGGTLAADVTLALATTPVYYVSPSGDDTDAGTAAEPFATIQQAITEIGTSGDGIIYVDSTEANPLVGGFFTPLATAGTITIRSANPGSPWYLHGHSTVTSGWTDAGGGVYSRSAPLAVSAVIVRSMYESVGGSDRELHLLKQSSSPTTPAAGKFGWSSGTLYVRLPGDADANSHSIVVPQGGITITARGTGGTLQVEDGVLLYHNGAGIQTRDTMGLRVTNSVIAHGAANDGLVSGLGGTVYLDGCELLHSDNDGINLRNDAEATAVACRFAYNYDEGASAHGPSTMTLIDCVLESNGASGMASVDDAVVNMYGCIAQRNQLRGNVSGQAGIANFGDVVLTIRGCVSRNNVGPGFYDGSTVPADVDGLLSGLAQGNTLADYPARTASITDWGAASVDTRLALPSRPKPSSSGVVQIWDPATATWVDAAASTSVVYGTTAGTAAEGNDARILAAIPNTTVDAKGDLLVGTADNTVTNVGVGSNGQVLTADSGEASGMKWADAAGGDSLTMVSGAWYVTPANVATTVTPARDTVTLCPVDLPAGTLTRIGVAITSVGGTGTEIRLGIYGDHGGGSSFPLILDAGTVAADDTAVVKEITISETVTAGRYWLAAVTQNGTGGLPAVRQNSGNVQGCAYLDTNSFAAVAAGYQATGVSGALPATLTPTNGINLSVRVVVR